MEKMTVHNRQSSSNRVTGKSPRFAGSCRFRLPKTSGFSRERFFKHLGNKVAAALCCVPMRRRPSTKVSSSGRSATPVDSHRSKAIEDCIEFINSSSLQRSNSVAASSR
ncbi:hypothetical protein L1049_014294 [Liquidambar formosana]|uniref:Josephin-like protein n=1 Tax=Liquidambar formosana TaxID=63359 RepID=A0AAP0WZG3_LIQFO